MGRKTSSFDWLPAGWEMDVKVRNTGRKDRYYIDPASGFAFRSMKEVFRYLETGKIGRRAFKHKDKGPMKRVSRYHPIFPTAEAGKLRLPKKNKAQKLIPDFQNLNSDAEVDLQKLELLKPCEGKEKSYEFIFPEAAKLVVNLRIEKRLYTEDIMDESKGQIKIIKGRKVLPRRTSKEVDGGEAELPQVLKPWKRFCRAEAISIGGDEGIHADNYDKFLDSEECRRAKTGNVADSEDDLDVLTSRNNPLHEEEPKQCVPNVLQEEHAHPGVNEFNGSKQQEVPFSLFSGELWNDPCIEFAIKTLTGDLRIGKNDMVTTSPEPSMKLHDAGSASSQDSTLEEARGDPCFEFAVKTLTGSVPKVENNHVRSVTLQQQTSSKGGGFNWPTFADYRVTGDLTISKDDSVATSPKPSVDVHDAGSASSQDSVLEEARGDPCFGLAVKTLTGNVPKVENIHVGNVTLQQQSSSRGGGFNWPAFADYRVTGDLPISKDDSVTTRPKPSMKLHDAGSPFSQDCALEAVRRDPFFGFAVNTLTGNVPKMENDQVRNVTSQQQSSSKGGGFNWPTFADYRVTGDLLIGKGDTVATSLEPSMELHDAGSSSTQDSALEEAKVDPCFGFAVKTSTSTAPQVENNQVGNVTLQQQCSSEGAGFNWPTFADYGVTGLSWRAIACRHSAKNSD